jgi:hypothetical protein
MICRRNGTAAQGRNGTATTGLKGEMQLTVRSTFLFIESGCLCIRQGAEHRSIILQANKDIIDLPSALL